MSIIRPGFQKFNSVIGELCNEARRSIWSSNPTAEFLINGVIYKKSIKLESSETKSTAVSFVLCSFQIFYLN